MSKIKKTRQNYVEYLNTLSPPYSSELWIIGGKMRDKYMINRKYGEALRKYDPIGFEIGFKEWRDR